MFLFTPYFEFNRNSNYIVLSFNIFWRYEPWKQNNFLAEIVIIASWSLKMNKEVHKVIHEVSFKNAYRHFCSLCETITNQQ